MRRIKEAPWAELGFGIVKTGRNKSKWLNAFPRFRKFLNQCVVCQEIGYDPIKLKAKKGLGFQKHAREFFHPLEVDEAGICTECVVRELRNGQNEVYRSLQ